MNIRIPCNHFFQLESAGQKTAIPFLMSESVQANKEFTQCEISFTPPVDEGSKRNLPIIWNDSN